MDSIIQIFRDQPAVFFVSATLLSLCVGSFLNVVIYRLPKMMHYDWLGQCREYLAGAEAENRTEIPDTPFNLTKPASTCRNCGNGLRAVDNIPVVSWIFLRGKCAHCGTKISARYPVVEILTALLGLAVVVHFGVTWQSLAALVFTWSLVALSFIDFDEQILPDSITLPMLWLGLLVNLLGVFEPQVTLKTAVIGAIAGYMVLWIVFQLFKLVTGKEGMGFGDFKLLAMLGAWLGWEMLPLIVILSAFAGAILGLAIITFRGKDKDQPMPFGPYLAIAGWIALMWGDTLVDKYLQFAGF